MIVHFEYTPEDFAEGWLVHYTPAAHRRVGPVRRRMNVVLAVVAGLVLVGLPVVTLVLGWPAVRGSLPVGRNTPLMGIADWLIAAFFWQFFVNTWSSAGLRGARLLRRVTGPLLVAVLTVAVMVALRSIPADAEDARPPAWEALAEVLRPHLPWLVPSALGTAMVLHRRRRAREALMEKNPALGRPHTAEVTAEGLVISTPVTRCEYRWVAVTRYVESAGYFLLYLGEHLFWIIPKRAFGSGEQLGAFRNLLHTVLDHRPAAFPVIPVGQRGNGDTGGPPVARSEKEDTGR